MSNEEISPRRFDVFTIREYEHQKQIKSEWIRLGVAFETRNGNFRVRLSALPLPNPKSGLAELLICPPRPREEGEQDGQDSRELPEDMRQFGDGIQHFNYRPCGPADAADLI